MFVSMITRRAFALLAASTTLLLACRKPTIESYRVPKESEPQAATKSPHGAAAPAAPTQGAPVTPPPGAAAPPGAMASTPVATASGPGLTWTPPANWSAKQGASAMRKATYTIKTEGIPGEAELAITAFPGDVGGELANVNRWRGQMSLPPISEADLGSALTRIEKNGLKISVLDVVGTGANAQRMLGAMVPHAGSTWFFKLLGPDAVVAKAKPEFMAFLETVKPAPAAQ
jgi:hypothetical protein